MRITLSFILFVVCGIPALMAINNGGFSKIGHIHWTHFLGLDTWYGICLWIIGLIWLLIPIYRTFEMAKILADD